MNIYHVLDWFFVFLHLAVIVFNLFGWIWRNTRKWNLYLLLLTGFFWFAFGYFYGWGYCPLTEWHFHVLYKLGEYPPETSYISYCIKRFLGITIDPGITDVTVLACYLAALGCSTFYILRPLINPKGH